MMLWVNKVKKSDMAGIKKNLNPSIKGDQASKIGVFGHFLQNGHQNFLMFCMMVVGNTGHHLSFVPYLLEIFIQD